MSRNTRKHIVGKKRENAEIVEREEILRDLARELHTQGWLNRSLLDLKVVVFSHAVPASGTESASSAARPVAMTRAS